MTTPNMNQDLNNLDVLQRGRVRRLDSFVVQV